MHEQNHFASCVILRHLLRHDAFDAPVRPCEVRHLASSPFRDDADDALTQPKNAFFAEFYKNLWTCFDRLGVVGQDRLEMANVQNITRKVEDDMEDKSVVREGPDYAIEIVCVFKGKFLDGVLLYDVSKLDGY